MNLQESSGIVNPLGLQERSEYAPNFGKGYLDQQQNQGIQNTGVNYGAGYRSSLEGTDKFNKQREEKTQSSEEMTIDMLRSKGPGHDNQRPLRRDISDGDYVNLGEELPQNRPVQQTKIPESAQGVYDAQPGAQNQPESALNEDFSLEQFKQNNAQLQAILMQLQTTPQFNEALPSAKNLPESSQMNRSAKPVNSSLKAGETPVLTNQISSAMTGDSARNAQISERSKYHATLGTNPQHQVSQFSYISHTDPTSGSIQQTAAAKQASVELPSSSQYENTGSHQMLSQMQDIQNFAPNPPLSQQIAQRNALNRERSHSPLGPDGLPQQISKIEMLQNAIASQQNIAQPKTSSSPMEGNQNYRNVFKPNQAFQNAGHQILDQQENFNFKGNQPYQQQNLQHSQYTNQMANQHLGSMSNLHQVTNKFDNHYNMNQQSQQNLVGEFTLQPRQPNEQEQKITPRVHASKAENRDEIANAHQEIMQNFDDIPIQKIQKMHGYQTGNGMLNESQDQQNDELNANQEHYDNDIDASKPLAERIYNTKWKIRHEAFKEINQLFYNEYAKFDESKNNPETKDGDKSILYSFEIYGPLLQQMIQDSNLVAAYEAMNCLHTFVRFGHDIKAVAFATHNHLLEKIQTNKPNFKDITNKILLTMLRRGQGQMLFPELFKRFTSRTMKVAVFSMFVVDEAFKTNTAVEEMNLKTIFRKVQENLSHQNKELRDFSVSILQHVYKNCSDDVGTILSHCKKLRPVQQKELKVLLEELIKGPRSQSFSLFDGEDGSTEVQAVKQSEAMSRHAQAAKPTPFETPKEEEKVTAEPVDLLTLLPENFQEIPYTPSINTKKKAMEVFNTELGKLTQQQAKAQGQSLVKNKDYALIYNTVVHMLEDKNMLVFLEAIKTVELLSILLGKNDSLKPIKVKTWISLITSKYSETKPAVIAAVDKSLAAIVKHSYPANQFVDLCINQIAMTHKNPRVKQFVLDHAIEQYIKSIPKEQIPQIFKVIKEKLVQIVLKDTNAGVRDAAVGLLITIRINLNQSDVQQFTDAVKPLPKYRANEIQKKVIEQGQPTPEMQNMPVQQTMSKTMHENVVNKPQIVQIQEQNTNEPAEEEAQQKPKFAKSLTEKIRSAKAQQSQKQQQPEQNFMAEFLQGRQISENYLPIVKSILEDFIIMKQNQFESINYMQLDGKWEASLRQLGEEGIKQAKPVFINASYAVIITPQISLFEYQQHLKCILGFIKRLYVIERSIERLQNGLSTELNQFIKIALLQNVWVAGNQGETCQMLQVSMLATNDVFEFTERLREIAEQPMIIQSPAALQIIEAIYVWLGLRLNEFMSKGMQIHDLEELRGFGLKYLDGAGFSEMQRQALIGIMIKFKDLVAHKKTEHDQNNSQYQTQQNEENELPSQSSRLQTPADQQDQPLQSSRMTQPQTAAFADVQQQESFRSNQSDELTAEHICKVIDVEFEKGLLLFKDMAQQTELEFATKEKIFEKLIQIVSESYRTNQQQQYKQAYALKALMWMKEETLGVEDCFKLTQNVMSIFAKAEIDEHDSTVEQYLLNFWTKDLSIRDLADRLALCVINSDGKDPAAQTGYSISLAQTANKLQLQTFNHLLKWFSSKRLFPDEKEAAESSQAVKADGEWLISDLRKVIFYVTSSVLDTQMTITENSRNLVRNCVAKYGTEPVKEFMEIQLLYQKELSLKLLDWFDREFATPGQDAKKKESLPIIPKFNIEKINEKKPEPSLDPVKSSTKITPRGSMVSASQSYKERRDQYKSSTQKLKTQGGEEQKKSESYKDLMSRIESNLQEVHQSQKSHKQIDEASGESGDEKFDRRDDIEDSIYEQRQRENEGQKPMRQTQTSAYYRSIEKKNKVRYTPSAEELADDQDIKSLSSEDEDAKENNMIEESLATHQVSIQPLGNTNESRKPNNSDMQIGEIEDQLQMSTIKKKHWQEKIQMLEMEKARIEEQTQLLQKEKDQENVQWKDRVAQMQNEHTKVIQNLDTVNGSYRQQVEENEKLKKQLEVMQQQHTEMMSRFESIEARLNSSQRVKESPEKQRQSHSSALMMSGHKQDLIVSVKKLQRIEDTFGSNEEEENMRMIQKIQQLLLSVDTNVDGELAQPLIVHYTKLKAFKDRLQMVNALQDALDENEDVLVALSNDVYRALLNFLLWSFAHEKQILEESNLNDQNEITQLSQQLVSKLLNSKRFTTSLVALFQLLREAMPDDLEVELEIEDRQYLRVIMRCIQRITKALQSEQQDLVRAFDVLIEMQKMFVRHPPEKLREDLPCLQDFDYIYRAMKDVSDKLIELQPEKVESFLSYAADQPQNAFIKYLKQMVESQ